MNLGILGFWVFGDIGICGFAELKIWGIGIWGIIDLRSPKSPISSKSPKSQNLHITNLKKLN